MPASWGCGRPEGGVAVLKVNIWGLCVCMCLISVLEWGIGVGYWNWVKSGIRNCDISCWEREREGGGGYL